jgi:hypothetical protein
MPKPEPNAPPVNDGDWEKERPRDQESPQAFIEARVKVLEPTSQTKKGKRNSAENSDVVSHFRLPTVAALIRKLYPAQFAPNSPVMERTSFASASNAARFSSR